MSLAFKTEVLRGKFSVMECARDINKIYTIENMAI